jgi:hypothetical protein
VIAKVAGDPNEAPLLGDRSFTAAILAVTAWHEAQYRQDRRGDHGGAFCTMQIHPAGGPRAGTTPEGWTGRDLELDLEKCIRAGLGYMRRSFAECHKAPEAHRLSGYASGSCTNAAGVRISRYRMRLARRALAVAASASARP